MHATSHRNQAGSSWVTKAVTYSVAATVAGAATGALLGAVGAVMPFSARVAISSVLALIAIAIGFMELGPRPRRVPQCDVETPQRWMNAGPLRWATLNGAALGIGATSRIGFWLWYAIPLGALLLGDPVLGALIYGLYGLVRGWAVWAFLLLPTPIGMRGDTFGLWVVTHVETSRIIAAAQLIALGTAVTIAVGF